MTKAIVVVALDSEPYFCKYSARLRANVALYNMTLHVSRLHERGTGEGR